MSLLDSEKRKNLKNIYVFSGLGADERVFQKIHLPGFYIHHIQWVSPMPGERIEEYAKKLSKRITSNNPVIIGLSFGGIMAIEIAKQIKTEKVIIISSAKTHQEIPFYYRIAGKLGLHKIIPAKVLKRANFATYWLFGIEKEEDKVLLKNILKDTDIAFLKWAIGQIVKWENKDIINNLTHIHGTADKILPIRYIKTDKKIESGGHLMILNEADALANLIIEEL